MSCRVGSSNYSSAFAKLHWKVVFITPVREKLVYKNRYYVFINIHSLPDALVQKEGGGRGGSDSMISLQ